MSGKNSLTQPNMKSYAKSKATEEAHGFCQCSNVMCKEHENRTVCGKSFNGKPYFRFTDGNHKTLEAICWYCYQNIPLALDLE